tara:strand:+ start:1545 stop:1883 length:339 start_codon:yes stop_codon:yes gene_type:complete
MTDTDFRYLFSDLSNRATKISFNLASFAKPRPGRMIQYGNQVIWRKKTRTFLSENPGHKTGNNLLSHHIEAALPLAIEGLTAVVGMGTGVSPHPSSPEWFLTHFVLVIAIRH